MSDYNPNDPRFPTGQAYDKYGNSRFDADDSGKGPYVLLAILVLIGLVGGLLYFNGAPKDRNEQALNPDRTVTAPATPGPAAKPMPAPAAPGANSGTPSDNTTIKQ